MGSTEFEEAYDDTRQIRGAIFNQTLGDIPRRKAVTLEVSANVQDVIKAMNEDHVGCALILDGGKLVGIFTERDVLTRVAGAGLDAAATNIADVMTKQPHSLQGEASIAFALKHMSEEGYRHIPLVEADGSPLGVVAVRDIINWIAELLPDAVLNLPPHEAKFPSSAEGG